MNGHSDETGQHRAKNYSRARPGLSRRPHLTRAHHTDPGRHPESRWAGPYTNPSGLVEVNGSQLLTQRAHPDSEVAQQASGRGPHRPDHVSSVEAGTERGHRVVHVDQQLTPAAGDVHVREALVTVDLQVQLREHVQAGQALRHR